MKTDSDGALDGIEVARGTDPLTPDNLPASYVNGLVLGLGAGVVGTSVLLLAALIAIRRRSK